MKLRASSIASLILVFLAIVALVMSGAANPAMAQTKVKLAVPAFSASFMPFFLAQEKGYWREKGLKVEIIRMKSALTVKVAIGGSIDFTAAAGSSVAAAVRGVKMRVLFAASNKAMFNFMAAQKINSAADLKGKVIAVSSAGGLIDTVTRDWILQNGVQPNKDVTIMVIGPPHMMLAALRAKRIVKAAMLSTPHAFVA